MTIQLWRSKNGFSRNGTTYEFQDVDSVTVTINERKHLTRGANSTNKKGYVYKENSKQADSVVFNVLNLSAEITNLLINAYKNEERLDIFCVDSITGENFSGKDAIITHKTQQLNITEGEETYNVELEFECFNLELIPKDLAE